MLVPSARVALCLGLVVATGWFAWAAKPEVPEGAVPKTDAWPRWRGPDGENHSPVTGMPKNWDDQPPKLEWTAEGMGNGFASVAVVNGRIYTTGNFDEGQGVVAVNEADGSVAWKATVTDKVPKHGYQGSRSTPCVDGDRLYVVTSDGQIACLQSEDGKPLWQRDFKEFNGKMMSGWGFSESPLVDGPWVLCTPGGKDAMIVALNKMTGETVWEAAVPKIGDSGKDGAGYSSIRISEAGGVKQYVQLVGRGVISVRAEDGKFLWGYNRVANGTANIPTPLVEGDYVFCSSGYGTGSALLKIKKSGAGLEAEEQYFLDGKTLQNHHGGMVMLGDYVYLGHAHNNGFPTCVKWKTGDIVWGGQLRGPGKGSAAVTWVDGSMVFRYQSGEVALIEATPEGYNLQGVFRPDYVDGPSWAHPVVVQNRLYLREQDKLMAYRVK